MKLTLVLVCFSFTVSAQTETGIKFVQEWSWERVLKKAKTENKYIFVDAYATWCGPCKAMDQNVYPQESVGDYFNDKFVSVKVQMDATGEDSEYVKSWYSDASMLMEKYQVYAIPAYLFFSPEGKLVHRAVGYKEPEEFIQLGREATDPARQYAAFLENYERGKKDYNLMGIMALKAQEAGDMQMANKLAADYKKNQLDKLSENQLLTKEHLEFIGQFPQLISSKDKFFKLFYSQPQKVDEIMKYNGWADHYVKGVITKEEINNKLWKGDKPVTKNPDWNTLRATVGQKYGDRIDVGQFVSDHQRGFYRRIEDWKEYARLWDERIKKNPPKAGEGLGGDPWQLNGAAWDAFEHCNDKDILLKALRWVEFSIALEEGPVAIQFLDTKANLLYKIGRVDEAIHWQEKALAKDKEEAKKMGRDSVYDYVAQTLAKMKKGEPTWPQKN